MTIVNNFLYVYQRVIHWGLDQYMTGPKFFTFWQVHFRGSNPHHLSMSLQKSQETSETAGISSQCLQTSTNNYNHAMLS